MKRVFLILGGVLLGFILVFFVKFKQFYQKIYNPQKHKVSTQKTTYNILLLGIGGGLHEGTYLTDTIILLHVDTSKNKSVLISIPRDIWVNFPTKNGETFHSKINTAYEMGLFPKDYSNIDPKYTKNQPKTTLISYEVSQITGQPVDYYVTVDFEGFKKAVDILGGIDINVQTTFDDYKYPIDGKEDELCGKDDQFKQIESYLSNEPSTDSATQDKEKFLKEHPDLDEFLKNATESPELAFPCRYEHLHFDKGSQHMEGTTALKFVRSRYSLQDGTDFGRARRQQQFLEAVKEKVLSIGFLPRVLPLMDELGNHINTDIPLDQMQQFLGEAKDSSKYQTQRLVFSENGYLKETVSPDGQDILIPKEGFDKWQRVRLWVSNTILGKAPPPTIAP